MRLNRGTITLLVASLVVIVAVLLLNNQPATAPGTATPTPEPGAGPLFPEIAAEDDQLNIVRFEAVNNETGEKTVMTKADNDVWTIDEATNASDLSTDQVKATGTMSILASLAAVSRFELGSSTLADFGLENPKFTLTLTDKEGKTYTVKIGNKAPANPRYYALVNDDTTTVYVVQQTVVDNLTRQMITVPPYVASPTPTATLTATLNPLSEVQQATATAAAQQTQAAQLTQAAEVTAEATAEATAEVTAEATAEITAEATAEITAEATVEATAEITAEATASPTPRPSLTPRPTSTPRPSLTPRPTSTPRPTATPTPS